MTERFMIGYDYKMYYNDGLIMPIYSPVGGHYIVVGGSGSGKSTAVLYWIYKLRKFNIELYIVDFKKSMEFSGISHNYAEYEDSYDMIKQYYNDFLKTQEGGDGKYKILIIDEIAGLLGHYSMKKDDKTKAEEIRGIMSSILMLGRSRKCFLWLSMQRYTSTIFPSSSGAGDNFHVIVGLGRLSVEGRKVLFAGEHFEGEDEIVYGQGKGIVMIDGQPLRSLVIPKVSKERIRSLLQ